MAPSKPSVQIVGGFDTASMPDIGYGLQHGACARWAEPLGHAARPRLVDQLRVQPDEIVGNTPIPPERVTVCITACRTRSARDGRERERAALTVGPVDHTTLMQKGHRPFVEAAAELPDVRFALVGSGSTTRSRSSEPARANVEFTGWLSDAELEPPTAAPRCTSRRRATRASAWRSPRRCSPAASRW